MNSKLVNIGHRGGSCFGVPNNTMGAFKGAFDLKIDGFETDIWLTKDLVPIINHGLSGNSLVEVYNIEESKKEYIFLNDTDS